MSFYRDVLNGFSHTRQSISKSIHLETPTTHGLFWFQVKQLDWKQLIYMLETVEQRFSRPLVVRSHLPVGLQARPHIYLILR